MEKREIDQYNMLLTVESYFDSNELIWTSNIPISDIKTALTAKIDQITRTATLQTVTSTGVTMNKTALRTDLEKKGFLVSKAIGVYVSLHPVEKQLFEQGNISKTDFTRFRAPELLYIISGLYTAATEIIEALEPYGVTQATLIALLAANDAFRLIIEKPGQVTNNRKEATATISVLLHEAIAILDNTMDSLMELFRTTQPEFVDIYFIDRKIHHIGVHTLSLEITTLNGHDNTPLAEAEIEIVGKGIKRISSEKGHNRVQNLQEGYYTLSVSRPNFVSQTIPFTIINHQTTQLVIEMQQEVSKILSD